MIRSIFFITVGMLSCLNVLAQEFTSTAAGGNWGSPLITWGIISGIPGSGDDVLISNPSTVNITNNQICQNLQVAGTLDIDDASTLTVESELEISSTGELDLTSGVVITNGLNIVSGGNLNISPSNYVEILSNISHNGSDRWIVNDGSIIIYSNITF